jgi:hypothetical protein
MNSITPEALLRNDFRPYPCHLLHSSNILLGVEMNRIAFSTPKFREYKIVGVETSVAQKPVNE